MKFRRCIFDGVLPFDVLMREEFSDVNLVVGSSVIAAHGLVLAAHSSLLHTILGDREATEPRQQETVLHLADKTSLALHGFSLESVTKMVHFLYSGELISDLAGLSELRSLALTLHLPSLLLHIEELHSRLSASVQEAFCPTPGDFSEEADIIANNCDDINNASFITLGALENLVEGEMMVGEEEMVVADGERDTVQLLETPVQTPDQSPVHNEDYTDVQTIDMTVINENGLEEPTQGCIELDKCDGFVFTCMHCDFYTEDKTSYEEHVNNFHVEEVYSCETCNKSFSSSVLLEEHKILHVGAKSYKCNTCGKAFSKPYHLKVHNRLHTGERPFKCDQCQRTFIDHSSLQSHKRTHTEDKPHKCKICDKAFRDRSNLRQHETTHKERQFQCRTCGQAFSFKRNMLRHEEMHKNKPRTEQIFKCDNCMKIFSTQSELVEHNQTEHPNVSTNSSKNFAYKCVQKKCQRVFPTETMFLSHVELVHEDKDVAEEEGPYSCQFCGVQFINIKTLRQHLKTFHANFGDFKCDFCNKKFKSECDLKSHMKDHTDKKRKYVCNYCSKAWEKPSDLVKHIRVHTGEKPFKCEVTGCDKSFSDKSLFLKHSRTHSGAESLMYVCGVCDKKFKVQANLEKHMKTHTNASYACSACGKKFYCEISLGAHINLHKGVNPYSCQFCGKEFMHSSDLQKHERVHTGVKPFKCEYCKKQFSDGSTLKKHERRHLNVTSNEQFLCFGCGKHFMKEEAFFKHATLFCNGRIKKCFGKPKEVPDNFPPGATLRCLNCKITLKGKEEFNDHLAIEHCKGPLYARISSTSSQKNIQLSVTTPNVVVPENEPKDNSSSVIKAISHLTEVIQSINSPKQEIIYNVNLPSICEEKENFM